jgi:hypothetical protein
MSEDHEQQQTLGLTAREVGIHMHLHPATVRKFAREGKIPCLILGTRKMPFSRKVIDELISEGSVVKPERK